LESPEQNIIQEIASTSRRRAAWFGRLLINIWRKFENTLFWLALLLGTLYFILQTPTVQNWLIQKITKYYSEELKTTVKIGHIDFEFFDNLVLEKVFIADQNGDTLLVAGDLIASLNTGLFDIARGRLEFNEITLRHTNIKITRLEGERADNLQFILDYFKKPKKTGSKPSTFSLQIQNLNLVDVKIKRRDEVAGDQEIIEIPRGQIRINEFNKRTQLLDIQSIKLTGLSVFLSNFDKKPLPIDPNFSKEKDEKIAKTDSSKTPEFHFILHDLALENSRFSLNENRISKPKSTPDRIIDWHHLDLQEISLAAHNIDFLGSNGRANLDHLGILEAASGFRLSHLAAENVLLNDSKLDFFGLKLQTPLSEISDTFSMDFRKGFDHFEDDVRLSASFAEGTHIALSELEQFSADIGKNPFFQKNRTAIAELSGQFSGKINGLKGRKIRLKLGPVLTIETDFDAQNMVSSEGTKEFNFKVKKLQTDIATMRQIVPGFNAPANFDKLGKIDFSGRLDGFSSNFVVEGNVSTDLGRADLSMNLDLNDGKEAAKYSGKMHVFQFDLGKWTGQKELGRASFSADLTDGRGLTATTFRANLSGKIDSIFYKNYLYQNLAISGQLDRFLFKGQLSSDDPNGRFSLRGKVDFQGIPNMDFSAEIFKIDLQKLHFSPRPITISGKIDRVIADGQNLDQLFGEATIKNLRLTETGKIDWLIPNIALGAQLTEKGERLLYFDSNLGAATVEGKFKPSRLPALISNLAARHYPEFAARFGLRERDTLPMTETVRFHVNLYETKDFTRFFDEKLGSLNGISIVGQVDGRRNFMKMNLQIPTLRYDKIGVDEVFLDFTSVGENAALGITMGRTLLSRKDTLAPISFDARLNRDTMLFSLNAKNLNNVLNNLLLSGKFFPTDSAWQISFDPSKLTLMGENWNIDRDNFLRFGKNFVKTQNFQIRNGDRVIALNSKERLGMILSLNQFDLDELHYFWKFRKLTFDGNFEVWADVDNIFTMKGIKVWFSSTDSISINKINYGFFNSYAEMKDLKSPLDLSLDLVEQRSGQNFKMRGIFLPPGSPRVPDRPNLAPGGFDLNIDAQNFPFAVLETFTQGISDTRGVADIKGRLWGIPKKMEMSGRALILDGWTTIDYLGSPLHIDNQVISLSSTAISAHDTVVDAVGILRTQPDTILDIRGKSAVVTGGMKHQNFRKWKVDFGIESDDFLMLKTTKKDNSDYYGTGIGKIDVQIGGDFSTTTIEVTATTKAGTRLFIPLSDEQDAGAVSFIKFKPKNLPKDSTKITKTFQLDDLRGLTFDMNLSLTPDAEVQLIFDEVAGDIITGHGHGDLGISYDLNGNLRMFGDYVIDDGNYLFTYYGEGALTFIQTNKPFTIKPGGTIRWDGDPLAATINLVADYKGLTTAPATFIEEELRNSPNDESEARRGTKVLLSMGLTGSLFKPDIAFDLQFPDLTGNLRSMTENKLRTTRQDPNEMSRQAFGLLVIGAFLPSSDGVENLNFATTSANLISNTLSQMVTSQLSNYLSNLISTLTEGGLINKIDVGINYNRSQLNFGLSQELATRLSVSLNNDRIRINGGANFGLPGQNTLVSSQGLQGGDLDVEIRLTADRRWVLKIYARSQADVLTPTTRVKFGAGVRFQREYDSLAELLRSGK
jgi:TamB, inner membrane protein subunit of TAM complex